MPTAPPARSNPATQTPRAASSAALAYRPEEWKKRMRAAIERCREAGCSRVAIYGAGTHTRAIAPLLESLPDPLQLLAIIDDHPDRIGQRFYGFPIVSRAEAMKLDLDAVILSANTFEDALWANSVTFRESGIRVVRLYDDPAPMTGRAAAEDADPGPRFDTDGLPLRIDHTLYGYDAYRALTRFLPTDGAHVFVDAGANRGNISERLVQVFPNATCYAFEPVEETYAILRDRFTHEPGVRPVHAALGARTESAVIHVNGCPGTSSLLVSNKLNSEHHGESCAPVRDECVKCWSLDDWASHHGVEHVDFLKIDVQGMELEMLRGAGRLLKESVVAVYSEAQLVQQYEGAAQFSEIDLYLRSLGFEIYQIHHVFSGGVEERTTCCDAIWVKKKSIDQYASDISDKHRD